MFKFRNIAIIVIAMLVLLLIFSACGRKGSLETNIKPTINITSYEGVEELALIDSIQPASFQQKIYWEASDEDGIVEKYAFRVVDKDMLPFSNIQGDAIGTPGYEIVDDYGWVYHYQTGADETIPLELSDSKTIWTDQVYAIINFPANQDGDSTDVTSVFEVKCKDNFPEECEESAIKYFHVNSLKPLCTVGSTKGDISGNTIGTGIVFSFNIIDDDQFVGSIPDYFLFKLEKKDLLGGLITGEEGYPDIVWSTKYERNIGEYEVTLDDYEGLRAALKLNNIENGIPQDSTYITAWAVDLAGIFSEPTTISFVVKEGFYPGTLIYNGIKQGTIEPGNNLFVLGANHFVTYIDASLGRLIPSVMTSEGAHYSTPFWISKNAEYTVIHSNDMKIYMKWGYYGEYQNNSPNPPNKKNANVLDERTGSKYFSEIRFYDLRMDGEAYYYAPLPASEFNILDEETGKEWLRIPVSHTIAQETIITGLSPGVHRFEVRAVDLQNVPDKTPTEFVFNLFEPIPASEKEGILILDDSDNHSMISPEAYVDSLYQEYYFEDYTGRVDFLDRKWLVDNILSSKFHFDKAEFCPTDLQSYKTIIYHSDQPINLGSFQKEYDVINLYLKGGGNLVLSIGANLKTVVLRDVRNWAFPLLDRYFGVDGSDEESILILEKNGVTALEPSFINLPYFVKAIPDNGFTEEIDLMIPSFHPFVNIHPFLQIPVNAIGPVAYFDESKLDENTTVIYRFGCVPAGDGPLDPSNFEYNTYNEQPVGLKRQVGESKCYVFSFPLSYMEPIQVKEMSSQISDETEMAQ